MMADNRSLVFALHGSVMSTMPLSWVREDRTEVLVDMMAGLDVSCLWNDPGIISYPHLHGIVPYRTTNHHDRCWKA